MIQTLQSLKIWLLECYNKVAQQVYANWTKLFMLLFVMHLVIEKDINFEISLNNPNQHQQVFSNPEASENSGNTIARPIAMNYSDETNDPDETSANQTPPSKTKEPEDAKFSLFSLADYFSFSSDKKGNETDPSNIQAKNRTENVIVQAEAGADPVNDFYNLSFILNPSFNKKYGSKVGKEKFENCVGYIKRFAEVALAEQKKYNIPASIKLAQALLESDAGNSRLCKNGNNHFGMKCFSKSCKKGHCLNFSDDTHKDFFRNFKNSWESYRAHSELLMGSRYKHLSKLGIDNYQGWAHGLKKAGYATDSKYAEKLIRIIEELELYRIEEIMGR